MRNFDILIGQRVQTMDMLIVSVTLTIGCWTAESCWTSSPPTEEVISETGEVISDVPQQTKNELFLDLYIYPFCDDNEPELSNSTIEDLIKWLDGEYKYNSENNCSYIE